MDNNLLNIIEQTKVFSSLERHALIELSNHCEQITLNKNDILFELGDYSDAVYILISGQLCSLLNNRAKEKTVGYIQPGETIGELGVFSNEPRSLTIQATEPCSLLKIPGEYFLQFCMQYPAIQFNVTQKIIKRAQKTIQLLDKDKIDHIVLYSYQQSDNQILFRENLLKKINANEATCLIEEDFKNQTLAEINEKIESIEKKCKVILYFIQSSKTDFAKFALNKATKIYISIDTTLSFESKRWKTFLHDPLCRNKKLYLVLLNPDSLPYRQTAFWLNNKIQLHHHVFLKNDSDYERLIRFLYKSPICLVLSGGGMKGTAHLGVIKAMNELNIPIDAIAGSSIGATVAGCYADDLSFETALKKYQKLVAASANPFTFSSFTWPVISLISSDKPTSELMQQLGRLQIENLKIPFFCTSSNLNQEKLTIHKKGLLWKAVRASVALPGIVPPMVIKGELHLDGGLLNNLPVDVMRGTAGENAIIIAVNLANKADTNTYKFPPILTLKNILLYRLGFIKKRYKFPHFVETFMNALLLGSSEKQKVNAGLANILINLDVARYGMTDIKEAYFNELIKIGYETALKELEKLK